MKRENESFSGVISKLTKMKGSPIGEYFGALKDSETLNDIEDDCRKIRARAIARHRK